MKRRQTNDGAVLACLKEGSNILLNISACNARAWMEFKELEIFGEIKGKRARSRRLSSQSSREKKEKKRNLIESNDCAASLLFC